MAKIIDPTPIENFYDDWGGTYASGPNVGEEWGKTHGAVEYAIKQKVSSMEAATADKVESISVNGEPAPKDEHGNVDLTIDPSGGGGTWEGDRYIVMKGNQKYLVETVELIKPTAPTVSTTSYAVVSGSFNVTVTNQTAGAAMYYKIGNASDWSPITNNKVSVPSGYTISGNNVAKTIELHLIALLNEEESDVRDVTLSVTPKVAAGSVSVVRNGNNNEFSTEATITFSASQTPGATSSYKMQSSPWYEFESGETTHTITVSSSASANEFKVKATKSSYVDSEEAGNAAFTLNTPKIWWGVVSSLPTNDSQIKALTGLERKTFPTVTLPGSGVQGKYLVMAYDHDTLGKDVTSLKMGGFDYEFTISTVGSFKMCVCSNLSASAAGLTAVYS